MKTINSTGKCLKKEDAKAFEYVLEDLLEMKASLEPHQAKPLKEFLLASQIKNFHFASLEGFTLDQHLVLINGGNPHAFGHLVFLNPQDGEICVRRLEGKLNASCFLRSEITRS